MPLFSLALRLDAQSLCILQTDVLSAIGLPKGSWVLFDPLTTITPGDLVLVKAEGRNFFGFYLPQPDGALFVLPDRAIAAASYRLLGVLKPIREFPPPNWRASATKVTF